MRLNRNTLLLLAASLVVIAAVLLISNQASAPEAISTPIGGEQKPVFGNVNQDAIVRFEVRNNETGEHVVMTKDAQNIWKIVEATNQTDRDADQTEVVGSMGVLASLKTNNSFTSNDVENFNLADYGLDKPTHTLSLASSDGTVYTLKVGAKNPGETRYYTLVEITPGAEATAEATAEAAESGVTVYLVSQFEVSNLIKLIAEPPYVPPPTDTPTPFPTPNPYSEVEQTATAAVEQTATAQATPEVTAEATGESTAETASEATAEATPEATQAP